MAGRMVNTIINILFLTYIILLISFFFLHQTLRNNVEELNYSTLDTIATTGVFTEDMYNELKKNVFRYGGGMPFQVIIKYEKKIDEGVYITKWKKDMVAGNDLTNKYPGATGLRKEDDILTYAGRPIPMHIGDKISIYLEAEKNTLFVTLLNAPFLGLVGEDVDMKIRSLKPAIIGRNANNVNRGYEVIAELEQKQASLFLNDGGNPVQIRVITETNPAGKLYHNDALNPPVNTIYGDTADEQYVNPTLGANYIFKTGEFVRQVSRYYSIPVGDSPGDHEMVIEYIQTSN